MQRKAVAGSRRIYQLPAFVEADDQGIDVFGEVVYPPMNRSPRFRIDSGSRTI